MVVLCVWLEYSCGLSSPVVRLLHRNVSFYFGTQTPSTTARFQCQLADSRGNVTAWSGLHKWQACSSPVMLAGVPDGFYVFSVGDHHFGCLLLGL